jgi:lysophospholipase L1-like esterase
VQRLRRETRARIAVLSLPLLGEDLDSEANERVRSYDVVIRDVAAAEGIAYLPLHETMEAALRALPPSRPRPPANVMVASAQARHFLLGRSFDAIGEGYGYRLLSDGIHLNGRGAALVADVVESYLRQQRDLPLRKEDSR